MTDEEPAATISPLTAWICDTCGDDITDPTRALVTWCSDDDNGGYDFQIVHKSMEGHSCDPGTGRGFVLSTELSSFLGANGLAYALSLLSPGPIKGGKHVRVVDFNGFVDLIRRTQTPWYEEARANWHTEQTQHWLADADQVHPYQPHVLERIAKQSFV